MIVAACAALAGAAAAGANQRDIILYNHSPSVPQGFYLRTDTPLRVGAFVTVRARDVAPAEAHRRGFEGPSDRFIKRVAAAGGAQVCGDGERLVISGGNIVIVGADDGVDADGSSHRAVVRVLHPVGDRRGDRHIVGWRGCRVLTEGEVLLLGDTADSFDGRYWGPVSVDLIEGVWRKL
ncbi:MAG: S26 family signal peptidase [Proteobacteria bacterium]|nr:S26 family signal peptidase [Pseudomonadota bacterium]